MKVTDTSIPDVKIIEPMIFEDERGFFFESFNHKKFEKAIGRKVSFVQDNHSKSSKGVLRGLHYQLPPHEQGKLIRVLYGEVLDVVVDVRKSSKTFGEWLSIHLSEENRRQVWIPEGFAHGFFALTEGAEILYKVTNYFNRDSEETIIWNDQDVGIDWELMALPLVSEKDSIGKSFKEAQMFK